MKDILNNWVHKVHVLNENVDDIPYADEMPNNFDDNVYEFGFLLYDKTQNILNSVGAKIMNNLSMAEVGGNIDLYKGILGRLNSFKSDLSRGIDRIYDYVDGAGYDNPDPKIKKLEDIHSELDDDLIILSDIIEFLDGMLFTANRLNLNYGKAFKLGQKNITTDINRL